MRMRPEEKSVVSTDGYRHRPAVLKAQRAANPALFATVSNREAIAASTQIDNGDKYLNGTELGQGLRQARFDQQPYQVWLKDPKRTLGVIDAARVQPTTFAALANAARQVMGEPGATLPRSARPDLANAFVAVPVFSPSGRTEAADIAYAVVPRNNAGKPRLVANDNGLVPFYYRLDVAFSEPRYFGPFSMTPDGVVAPGGRLRPLVVNGEVDMAATRDRFERSVLFAPISEGDGFFLEPTRVQSALKDELVRKVLRPQLGEATWTSTLRGDAAIDAYLNSAHDGAQTKGTMRALVRDLMESGAVSDTVYLHGTKTQGVVESWGDVLLLIDKRGRAFGFIEGTL